jgi:hypothetical protein
MVEEKWTLEQAQDFAKEYKLTLDITYKVYNPAIKIKIADKQTDIDYTKKEGLLQSFFSADNAIWAQSDYADTIRKTAKDEEHFKKIKILDKEKNFINYESSYDFNYSTYSYNTTTTGYDGEGQITSALDYVLNDDMPKVYMTTGHNELSLSNTFTSALNKENVDYETVNLMDLDAIPDDAACLFINGATSDFSSDDKDKVIDYLNNGGKVILVTGYTDEETPNIDAILSYMNLSIAKGLVVENDSNGYYRSPYYILPTQSSDSYTSGTYGKYLFLPYSQGIIVPEEVSTDETATGEITYDVFLSTSDSSFAKQDVNNTQDFSQSENDMNGPFALGVEAVKTLDDGDATLVVYGCEQLFTDDANSVVSGANLTLFTNTFSGMTDHETSVSIPVKSYEVSNLVVDSAQILLLGLLVTVILPVNWKTENLISVTNIIDECSIDLSYPVYLIAHRDTMKLPRVSTVLECLRRIMDDADNSPVDSNAVRKTKAAAS